MISPRRRLVAASILLVLEAVAFALLVTESVTGAIAAVGFTCVSLWVHVVLHECGHLVVAKLLRLPVIAVSSPGRSPPTVPSGTRCGGTAPGEA